MDIPVGLWMVDTYLFADSYLANTKTLQKLSRAERRQVIKTLRKANMMFEFTADGKWRSWRTYTTGLTEFAKGRWKLDGKQLDMIHTKKYGKTIQRKFSGKFDKTRIDWVDDKIQYRLYRKD